MITSTITYPQQKIAFYKRQSVYGNRDRSGTDRGRKIGTTWLRPKSDSSLRALQSHFQWYNKNLQKQMTFAEGTTSITTKINLAKPKTALPGRKVESALPPTKTKPISVQTEIDKNFKLPKD